MVSRLATEMIKVLQADTTSIGGMRNVIDEETELLQGFDFNVAAKLNTTLYAPSTDTIDPAAGTLTVDILTFIMFNMVAAPGSTTHYRINSGKAEGR
ncbi:MAG: hypothetical protein H7334_05420 [Ferruginibacter sp.]|nr:hypothetical protein [Ferruginibacter sp.]